MRELRGFVLAMFVTGCNCSSPPLVAQCTESHECGPAGLCQQGGCVTCTSCDTGAHCLRDQCLPGNCGSTICPSDQACINGACTDADCVGVVCPTGQSCAYGACYGTTCGGQTCVPGTVCYNDACVSGACVNVVCPSGETCANGVCLGTSCGAATCASGQVCVNAACVDATCVGVLCSSDAKCVAGACVALSADAGSPDSGTPDSGTPDSGTPDAGTLCPDAQLTCSVSGTVYMCGAGTAPNSCQVCLPNISTSGFTALPDGTPCGAGDICAFGNCTAACFIDGMVVAMGAADPTGGCRACQPAISTTSYTSIADGTPCASGEVCRTGACTAGCFISGAFVPPNAVNPSGTCQQCRPTNTSTAWSDSVDGTACAPGKVCETGLCNSACFIDGGLYDAGALDPSNPCHDCQPQVTTSAFSNLPDMSVCGAGATCNAGSCDCSGGRRFCAPRCVDLSSNSANCGGCGSLCDAGTACFASACEVPKSMPTARAGVAAATASDGRIYVVGGGTAFGAYGGGSSAPPSSAFDTVEIFDPATNSWSSGPSLPTARLNLAAVVGKDGRIYTLGGWSGAAASNAVEIYDPSTGSYDFGVAMPLAREDPGVTVGTDGKIYAVCGGNVVQSYNQLQVYDPIADSWASLTGMPQQEGGVGFATGSDGRQYAVGGGLHSGSCSANATTFIYDAGTPGWVNGPALITPRMSSAVLTGADGRIYAVGGGAGCASTYYRSVEVLTPGGSSWSALASLNVARLAAGGALGKDGRIYVFGGQGAPADGGTLLNSVEVFDPSVNRWTASP